jgi:hypothetical protein
MLDERLIPRERHGGFVKRITVIKIGITGSSDGVRHGVGATRNRAEE